MTRVISDWNSESETVRVLFGNRSVERTFAEPTCLPDCVPAQYTPVVRGPFAQPPFWIWKRAKSGRKTKSTLVCKCSYLFLACTVIVEFKLLKVSNVCHFVSQGIANKYPDFKSDHALALLLMRGDVTRTEARQVCTGRKPPVFP